jgi:hypothetical protein
LKQYPGAENSQEKDNGELDGAFEEIITSKETGHMPKVTIV